jgi:hypothetical protein
VQFEMELRHTHTHVPNDCKCYLITVARKYFMNERTVTTSLMNVYVISGVKLAPNGNHI